MAPRGFALLLALLATSGAAGEVTDSCTDQEGLSLLQRSPGQTRKVSAQVGRLDAAAVGATYDKVHRLLDRHDKISSLVQHSDCLSSHTVHDALNVVKNTIRKLRRNSESLLEVAAGARGRETSNAALLRIETPASELQRQLDRLESVCLLQQSSGQAAKAPGQVEKYGDTGQSNLTAVSAAYEKVHNLLNRHEMVTKLIQRESRRSGHALKAVDVKQAHSTVGQAIKRLRQNSESLFEVVAAARNHEALHSALLQIESRANELKKSLDHLESVCLLEKSPSQHRKVSTQRAAVGSTYDHVHSLLDRYEKITGLIQRDGRHTGHEVHEAHSVVGQAIKKLRQSSESLIEAAAGGNSHSALHSALLQIGTPADEMKRGLDHLEEVCLLQTSTEQHRQGRSELAAVGATYAHVHRLLDRHDKIMMLIQRASHHSGDQAKNAHSTIGKAIKKLRKSSESIVGLAAASGNPAAVHTLLRKIEAPTNQLERGLDHLEGMLRWTGHTAKAA